MMKQCLILCFLFGLSLQGFSGDPAGIKGVVKEEVMMDLVKKFLPQIMNKLKDITIPNAQFEVNLKVSTLYIYLENIHVTVNTPSHLQISLKMPNQINIVITNLTGTGHFDAKFKVSYVSESDHVTVSISRLDVSAILTLTTQESEKEKGKLLPSAYVSSLIFDLVFDFEIHGSLIAEAANYVKSLIKGYIDKWVNDFIRDTALKESKAIIADFVKQMTIYVQMDDNGLAVDYSLLSAPKIMNNYLFVNANGAIVNLKIPETKQHHIPYPTNLPDFDPNGKKAQLFLSDFSIVTALNTLYLSKLLDYTIRAEDLPSDSTIKLNTSWLGTVISGMTKMYGSSKPCNLRIRVVDRPIAFFEYKKVNVTVTALISIYVKLDNGSYDDALGFNSTLKADGDAHLEAQGQIAAYIHDATFMNSKMVYTKLPDAKASSVEKLFNFASFILVPVINRVYLKKMTVKLPTFAGISFEDSTVATMDHYIELNVNPYITPDKGRTSTCEIDRDGSIFQLEKLGVSCNSGEALQSFGLRRPKSFTYFYEFTCAQSTNISQADEYQDYTQWSTIDDETRSLALLESHYVQCKSGYVLKGFQLERNENTIRYIYQCVGAKTRDCGVMTTEWKDGGNGSTSYLQNQKVELAPGKMITGFQLNSEKMNTLQLRYTVEYCDADESIRENPVVHECDNEDKSFHQKFLY